MKVTTATALRVGNYAIIEGLPCVIKSIQTSKTGKHGHAKCRIEAVSIINDQKKIIVVPGHEKIEVPIIEKKNGQLLSITNNIANVMDLETFETFDIPISDELKETLKEGDAVQYWTVMDQKVLKGK
ncbi:translation initiation factor IF-5A [Candidatus Woesearchaeota archaeon]|nr:translation initiation factor IF-5A [Candidatus Woesearchaeota archaeon]